MLKEVRYSFTRPADTTAYASGDLVANSTTAGSVVPMAFRVHPLGGKLVSARMVKTDVGVTAATFSVRLFGASPTVANGDNGAISHNVSDRIATIDFAIMVAGTDDAYTNLRLGDTGFLSFIPCPYSTVYGLVEAKGAYTPVSGEVFTVSLTFDLDI